ncbi:MAG: type II toxin-antitoxin system HicB family antitoxin [Gammaproteobacteria bacterium]|nr:type II toxin-antitoxin system HicB family antitoxin [Gammaproteobacteria bacterium]
MEYTIVIEQTPRNSSAFAPDLPGCVATGATREEAVREMGTAIAFHIESLREHREPIPTPRCTAAVVDVAAAG